ncbi:MAG: hypothetical protein KGH75_14675, partial [Rhodospirillales bacterium]|nr:hypothetical protein [Rhodospirillales bacterium]
FAAALDVVRQDAVKQASKLGKAASDRTVDGHNYTPEEIGVLADQFTSEMDTSGLSLAWDDYSDTLQAVAADGSKQEVARIVAADPTVAPAATEAGFDMLDHQDPRAIEWAQQHAVELLGSDGSGGQLEQSTRDMIRQTVAKALEDHATNDELAQILSDAYAFTPDRAELIARTEVANALTEGAYAGAVSVGMKVKRWLLSNDEGVCPICTANAAQEWIPIDKPFQSGDLAPIAHPRCRCDAAYRRKPAED